MVCFGAVSPVPVYAVAGVLRTLLPAANDARLPPLTALFTKLVPLCAEWLCDRMVSILYAPSVVAFAVKLPLKDE